VVVMVAGVSGCIDPRIKREVSLINVMTVTAAEEFNAATTPEAKVQAAKEFLDVAPKHTQVLEDYVFGRKPAGGEK